VFIVKGGGKAWTSSMLGWELFSLDGSSEQSGIQEVNKKKDGAPTEVGPPDDPGAT